MSKQRGETERLQDAQGEDEFGFWKNLHVERKHKEPVIQRMRWIPPGLFIMGSSKNEPGHYRDEEPLRPVSIGQGFWLFDTPCTQELWEAVMADNWSRFKSPDRPVELVSWHDAQVFLSRLNDRMPAGPGLSLPSEAQWEYACRAGAETALYSGPIEILGDMNAPALDAIAWYGGNSGVDFDLREGENTTEGWWKAAHRQYSRERAGTRKVKGKQPNAWGLYDMLGNVWEWCEDFWHDDYYGAPMDGSAWIRDAIGFGRVVRGGAWSHEARYSRCASRHWHRSAHREDSLGFRCAQAAKV